MTDEERKLWDGFARAALQGLLVDPAYARMSEADIATAAYTLASAMLGERRRRTCSE